MYFACNDVLYCGGNPSVAAISINNGVYNSVYLSNNPDEFNEDNAGESWTDGTLLFADFDRQSLNGSNFEYGSELYSIKLKRREIGYENKPWILLYEQLAGHGNINFVYNDYFARGRGVQYEYALVPMLNNGTELPYIKTIVTSVFYGAVITDGNTSYHILLDPEITETNRNRQSSVVTTLNSKYPFVFFSGKSNYTSGSFSGTAIRYLGNDKFDPAHSHWYREDMIDWLTNGESKILKIEDGRIWMVVVNGSVKASNSEHPDKVTLSFDFTEIGSVNSDSDMKNNGFENLATEKSGIETYTITFNPFHVNRDNSIASVIEGSTYSVTLTADHDYEINGAVVNMGGINVTATTYTKNADGTATIEIPSVSGNITIIASATRIRIVAQSFQFEESSFSVVIGNTHKLYWTTYPTGAHDNTITWKTDNKNIATVDKDGVVEGVSTGSTKITGVMDGLIATCTVTVTSS